MERVYQFLEDRRNRKRRKKHVSSLKKDLFVASTLEIRWLAGEGGMQQEEERLLAKSRHHPGSISVGRIQPEAGNILT